MLALLIPTVSLPSLLDWELNVRKTVAKVKLHHDEQKKVGHFMAVPSILIAHSHLGINRRVKLALNVNTPSWLKSGKRTRSPQLFVPSAVLKRPTQQPD